MYVCLNITASVYNSIYNVKCYKNQNQTGSDLQILMYVYFNESALK